MHGNGIGWNCRECVPSMSLSFAKAGTPACQMDVEGTMESIPLIVKAKVGWSLLSFAAYGHKSSSQAHVEGEKAIALPDRFDRSDIGPEAFSTCTLAR